MICPKCGTPLRPSKQKTGYFLCDTCRIRMSENYIKKISSETSIYSKEQTSHIRTKPKRKLHITVILLFLISVGCTFAFIHFDLYSKMKDMLSPSKNIPSLTESVALELISAEVSSDITVKPAYGHKWVLLNLQITNNSPKELSVNTMNHFEFYMDTSKIPYSSNSESVLSDLSLNPIDSTLLPGEICNGFICLELPDSWELLTVHYVPEVWSSSELSIDVKKPD